LASDITAIQAAAKRWFDRHPEALDATERRVLDQSLARRTVAQNPDRAFDQRRTFGERLADRVAAFGGSWTFIIGFSLLLLAWAGLNLLLGRRAFDPYPFIFLNLLLSTLAALQAPVIMMSQNRQAAKDRLNAAHDYEVNLKAEIEIMALHEKFDRLRAEEIEALVRRQEEQLTLIRALLETQNPAAGST
jgi:uncharacterized membrane protein